MTVARRVNEEREDLLAYLAGLNDELAEIDERRAAIQGQVEKAQADRFLTGEFADPDWFRRAKGALRHLGVERNQVCREIGEANRRLREINGTTSQDTFRQAVREVVDAATWRAIVARHELITATGSQGATHAH